MKWIKGHPHLTAILCFIIIGLIVYAPWVSLSDCLNSGDVGNEYTPFFFYHQQTMLENKEMPLWIHHISSGTPFFAVGDKPILYPFTILSLMIMDYGPAFNWNVLFHLFLSGIGMYFLVYYLIRKPSYAFISGLVYMLNFHMFRKMMKFWGVAWVPWVMLCFYLAFDSKDKRHQIGYSILAALGLAAQFHVGSIEVALYTVLLVIFLSLFRLLSTDFSRRFKAILLIGIVSGLFFTGFIAVKLLPNAEFGSLTTRAQGISLEQAKGSYYYWTDIEIWNRDKGLVYAPKSLLLNLTKGCQKGACSAIGFIPSLLLLGSLVFWRKKTVLLHWLVLAFSLFMVTASFVFEFFYNYIPAFDKLQHAERLGILYIFAASILVAYGAQVLCTWAQNKWQVVKKHKHIFYVLLIIIIIIDMVYIIGFSPLLATYNFGECKQYQKAPIMEHLSTLYDKEDPFRIKVFESQGRGGVAQYMTIPLGLDIVDGQYGGLWLVQYINQYLSVARNYPAKFWGNLNTKYVTMQEKRNITGLTYVQSFTACPDCIQPEAAGPHLYKNENFLPRAFWTDNAVLIVGKNDNAIQSSYSLLANDQFKLKNQIIINGKYDTINEYGLDELSKYKVIFLMPGSVDQNSNFVLKRYVDQGGILIPNILEGKETVTIQELADTLSIFNTTITPLKIAPTANTITVDASSLTPGFIVVSERMHLFPGWKVFVDKKKVIDGEQERVEKTNILLSSMYLKDQANEVKFIYSPHSFEFGKKITLITIALALFFAIYLLWYKRKKFQ